jgi:hypothetical protein
MIRRTLPALTVAALLLGPAGPAAAVDLGKKYEEALIRWAMGQAGLRPDPAPAGKIIERIEIVRENIIADSDPWPNFLNIFHLTTRDHVVRREMLVKQGEVWDAERVAESARNLRKLPILAVVRTAACRSRKPGHVVLLVVTKDLWSIRLNSVFSLVGLTFQTFELNPTEQNFLGLGKQLSLHLSLKQFDLERFRVRDLWSVGAMYADDRLAGTRLALLGWARPVISGAVPCGGSIGDQTGVWCPQSGPGTLEGVDAGIQLGRPLYSLATRWAFNTYFTADIKQVRLYVQGPGGPELRSASFSVRSRDNGPDRVVSVPRVYDQQLLASSLNFTRSHGRAIKHDVTSGLYTYSRRFSPPDNFPFEPDVVLAYARTFLPYSEDVSMFFVSYRTHATRFLRLQNIDGFAGSEDFLIGHDVKLELRFAANLTYPEQGFLESRLDAAQRWLLGGDLLTLWLTARSRWQPGIDPLLADDPFTNALLELGINNISPVLGIGRLHAQLSSTLRHNNLDRTSIFLGGDTGLRGYQSQRFEGQNAVQVNVEYRTQPINLWTLHVGMVLFYDGGGVWGGPDPEAPQRDLSFRFYNSLGLGFRGNFPQFDKGVLRIDLGIPLDPDEPFSGTWFSVAFRQAF